MNLEDLSEVKELKADSRGRVNLGTEYKDSKVKVAILEIEDDE